MDAWVGVARSGPNGAQRGAIGLRAVRRLCTPLNLYAPEFDVLRACPVFPHEARGDFAVALVPVSHRRRRNAMVGRGKDRHQDPYEHRHKTSGYVRLASVTS